MLKKAVRKMLKKIKIAGFATLLALSLTACQTADQSYKAGYDQLLLQTVYDKIKITGRIGLISKAQKTSLRFVLEKDKNLKTLHLLSPIGHTLASLFITDNFVRLKSSDGQIDGTSLKDVLYEASGISLPDDNILALIMGALDEVTLDKKGYPLKAQVGDFFINYKGFATRQSLMLPSSIDIKHTNYRLKIALDD